MSTPTTRPYPTLSIAQAIQAIIAAVIADIPLCLSGAPGVGKTSLARQIGASFNLPVYVFLGSIIDPTDVGGFPVVTPDGTLVRMPMKMLAECLKSPALLLIDELLTCPATVQAALLALILDRRAGDITLHPDTRILVATNPPEQSPGGVEASAPLVGRMTWAWLQPTVMEVAEWFISDASVSGLPTAYGANLREALMIEHAAFSATIECEPKLIQFDPPETSIQGGAPWGAPRNWARGLRGMVAAQAQGAPDEVTFAMLAGAVGDENATAYVAISKLRADLPTIEDICADPMGARVPDARDRQIAALGLLAHVAQRDVWAAWSYAARLHAEIAMACARILLTRAPKGASKHQATGTQARVRLSAAATRTGAVGVR